MSSNLTNTWKCPKCNFDVFNSKLQCSKCLTKKPEKYKTVLGRFTHAGFDNEWKCPICNFLVFNSKSECNKCLTKKPSNIKCPEYQEILNDLHKKQLL